MIGSILLTIPLFISSPSARAAELPGEGALGGGSLQVTDDLDFRYYHYPPEQQLPGFEDRLVQDYIEQTNRLNLLAVNGTLSIGAQVDEVALLLNRYILDGTLYRSWPLYDESLLSPSPDVFLTLEKLYLQQRWARLELTVGDTYASFGRGLALNIVKNTDIDIDTSIRGVKAVFRGDRSDVTLVTGLSNRQQVSQDNRNLDIERDIPHMVTGLRGEIFGLGPVNLGGHGVLYRFGRSLDDGNGLLRYGEPMDAAIAGATVDMAGVAGVDWFVEGDVMRLGEDLRLDGRPLAYAAYGSASAYPGPFVVLVEAKRTRDTERLNTYVSGASWEVASVPTLEFERVITEDSSAAVNSNDLAALKVRVDYALKPGEILPYVSVAAMRDCDLGGLHFNRTAETILHPIGGLEVYGAHNTLQLHGGYRMDRRDAADATGGLWCEPPEDADELPADLGADGLAHLDLDVHLALFGDEGLELALGGRSFHWGENAQQQQDFLETSNTLTWLHGEALALTLFQDWSNNPLIDSTGNITEHTYGAVELQWKATPAVVVRAFYGAYKAGIHCSGGQCRSLPGFEGARLSVSGTL